ncbi:hypothetical protein GGH94_006104, partial [Coemansia aciculifera]
MRTPSLLQFLPPHAIELIVSHVAGSSRLRFGDVTESSEEYAVLLMPLLSVCRDFRATVLARFCKTYTLDLTCFSDQGNDKMALWPERLRGIVFPTHLYAQELNITLGVFSVYNGTALKELLREPHGDFLFPMARSLKVTLTQTTREQRLLVSIPAAQDIEPNIRAFVQRIRLMAPTTRKVCISLESRSTNESQFVVQHFSSLVAHLSQLGNTIEHNYDCRPMRLEPPPTDISSLTYIDWSENNGDLLMQLARHNAPTLRTLDISLRETESISHLIQNVDGSSVQYPYLNSLRFERRRDWTEDGEAEVQEQQPLPVFPGAIPFLHLRHLSFTDGYPFGDDTLFRGNAGTLEYLYLDLTPDVSFMKFVLTIGPNARVRELNSWLATLLFRAVMPLLGEYTCIQVLSLIRTAIDLWDVIALVKTLPLLTDLHTQLSELQVWPSGISKHKLPAYVIANYAPMGER